MTYSKFLILSINVFLAIFVIFLNKMMFSSLHFNFPVAKTTIDYVVTWCCTELCRRLNLYQQIPWEQMPLNRSMISLVVVVAVAVPLNNLSLNSNAVGTYQLLKLLVTPSICLLEYVLNGETMTLPRILSLIAASVGVALFTVKDVQLKFIGLVWALLFLPAAAYYKVHWKRVQKSFGVKSSVLSMLHRVYPLAIPILIPFSFVCDPPGVLDFPFAWYNVALLISSGVAIFVICLSSLQIVMLFSPLTHQVLGLVKTAVSVILSVLVLGAEVPNLSQGAGLLIALTCTGIYAKITTSELDDTTAAHKKFSSFVSLSTRTQV